MCHCEVVSDQEVATCIAGGARTLSQVCGATGAGRTCGGCVFSLKQLLCQHGAIATTSAPEVAGATG
ncbi:MAG: (2Fe-2S)-binding protein [Kribbellaceae bacterium]